MGVNYTECQNNKLLVSSAFKSVALDVSYVGAYIMLTNICTLDGRGLCGDVYSVMTLTRCDCVRPQTTAVYWVNCQLDH